MAYSMEFRRAVAKAYDECGSSIQVAEDFGCCESWVRRLIQRRRATGSLDPLPAKLPDNNKLDERDLEKLKRLVADTPDADLIALDDALNALAEVDARKSRAIELRFFGGLSIEEAAVVLEVSPETVKRDCRLAKAWLLRWLTEDEAK